VYSCPPYPLFILLILPSTHARKTPETKKAKTIDTTLAKLSTAY
jgi:hypothetical protein